MFQYHGAEHMTIHALEAGEPLRPEYVRRHPTAHPRCGTEFLVVVILLSILAFSLVGKQTPLVMIASRILLIPVIAAVGYELLRLGARHRSNPVVRVIMWPGHPGPEDHDQAAHRGHDRGRDRGLEEAIQADGDAIPEGGLGLAARPDAAARRDRQAGCAPRRRRRTAEAAVPVSIDPPLPG